MKPKEFRQKKKASVMNVPVQSFSGDYMALINSPAQKRPGKLA
jgi:hypothetical protein